MNSLLRCKYCGITRFKSQQGLTQHQSSSRYCKAMLLEELGGTRAPSIVLAAPIEANTASKGSRSAPRKRKISHVLPEASLAEWEGFPGEDDTPEYPIDINHSSPLADGKFPYGPETVIDEAKNPLEEPNDNDGPFTNIMDQFRLYCERTP